MTFKLDTVIVFQSSASLKMIGNIKCDAGENKIKVGKLPSNLDKDSLRVKGTGPGKIANIIIEKKFTEHVNKEEIAKLMEELQEFEIKERRLKDSKENIKIMKENEITAMNSFSNEFSKYYSLGKINIDQIKKLSELFDTRLDELSTKILDINIQLEDIKRVINKLKNEIKFLNRNKNIPATSYNEIIIVLDARESGEFKLELNYTIPDASWEPFYDIIIGNEDVEIDLMANVYNNSELDWNDVNITISTASTKPVKIQKPSPFEIDEFVQVSRPTMLKASHLEMARARLSGKKLVMNALPPAPPPAPMAMEEPIIEEEIEKVSADISSNLGVQVYKINTRFTIPSDKNPKPIPLHHEKLESNIEYFWSTLEPSRVLCNNKVKNKEHLFLPGKAKVYVNDEYIGETYLDLIAPNEEFKIGERVSYDIKITKSLKKKRKQKEGALKGKRSISYKYEIKIENLNKVKDKLILYDRIPYSISERIKVKIISFSDEPKENVLNVIKFELDMGEIKEEKTIMYEYEVIYEKDVMITPPLP
ncbi:MAG: mucoidy inhibitor MuiA family protein [Promethearchaeota archaeon]